MKINYCTNFPSFVRAILGKEGAQLLSEDGKATRDMMKQYPLEEIKKLAVIQKEQIVFLIPREQVEQITNEHLEKAQKMAKQEGIDSPVEIRITEKGKVTLW